MTSLLKAYEATNIGLVRKTNEDSYITIVPNTYIVADGMGGHVAGEIASNILIKTAKDILSKDNLVCDEALLEYVILAANKAILDKVTQNDTYKGMGTTATVFHKSGNRGIWAHVGDSRIYLLHDGDLQQITRDHSLVFDLVKNGTITKAEAKTHPQRNMLTRAVGVDKVLVVDKGSFDLAQDDIILLCTDGLTNMVSEAAIKEILLDKSVANKAACLIEKALDAGGKDNITVIAVDCNV
ncbi:MAG: Stp1/IreP family PP2C-type Ser/Thr phosphatase [Selenomonadaceae bacterium]